MTIAKDKWMKYKGTSGRAVLTLCGVYGVAYLFSLQPVNRIYYSVLNVLLAVGIYSMLQQTEQNLRKIEEKRDRKSRICYTDSLREEKQRCRGDIGRPTLYSQ